MTQKLQISVENGMEFAKLCAELDGYVRGAQGMAEYVKALAVRSLAAKSQPVAAQTPAGEPEPAATQEDDVSVNAPTTE